MKMQDGAAEADRRDGQADRWAGVWAVWADGGGDRDCWGENL